MTETGRARFYDGRQAKPFDALLEISASSIRIRDAADQSLLADWPAASLCVISLPGNGLSGTLSGGGNEDARLVLPDAVWNAEVAPLLAQHRRLRSGIGAGAWAALAVACLIFMGGIIVYSPAAMDMAARYVPESWEEKLGAYSAASLMAGAACPSNPLADAALRRLLRNLDVDHRDFSIYVSANNEINALTVPGHNIVILNGLLARVKTQGQLAAVLAHEAGHAHYRHPLRMVMETLGGSILLGLVTGNSGLAADAAKAANQILLLRGNRDFESQADAYGMAALVRIGQPPVFLGDFLKTMPGAAIDGQIPEWLLTHPNTENRLKAMHDELMRHPPPTRVGPAAPLFTPPEWQAIQHYCGKKTPPMPPAAKE